MDRPLPPPPPPLLVDMSTKKRFFFAASLSLMQQTFCLMVIEKLLSSSFVVKEFIDFLSILFDTLAVSESGVMMQNLFLGWLQEIGPPHRLKKDKKDKHFYDFILKSSLKCFKNY